MKKYLFAAVCTVFLSSFQALAQKDEMGIWYQGEVNIGYAINMGKLSGIVDIDGNKEKMKFKSTLNHPFVSTVQGLRITKYGFAGIGLGVQYGFGKAMPEYGDNKWNMLFIPVFGNLKGYFPVTKNFAPYVSLSFGYNAWFNFNGMETNVNSGTTTVNTKNKGGYFGEYGVGVKFLFLNLGLGIMQQSIKEKVETTISGVGTTTTNSIIKATSFYVKVGMVF